MRIGVAEGPVPYDLDLVDERLAAKLAELGFSGVFATSATARVAGLRSSTAESASGRERCWPPTASGWRGRANWAPNLVHPDESVRTREVDRLRAALEVAAELGADGVTGGCGSRNPRGGYWPHRENHSAEAQDCLVRSLKQVAPAAESLGVTMALECHVLTTLDSPETVREILDAVTRPPSASTSTLSTSSATWKRSMTATACSTASSTVWRPCGQRSHQGRLCRGSTRSPSERDPAR